MAIGVQIDGNGLSVKSFREIREALADKMHGIFGENLDLSPSSPDGQLIDLFCYAYSDVAEAIQATFAELDVASAEGTFLDNIGRIMGIDREGRDDDAYRDVLLNAKQNGLATYDNMLSYLKGALGSGITLIANDNAVEEDGIPGHSVCINVSESVSKTDDEIAQAIWHCKPAGIATFGAELGIATDAAGLSHKVFFNKITATSPYYMRITITEYTEEMLPLDYEDKVKDAVHEWSLTEYTPGKDIIPQRAIGAIYQVPGIDTVNVEVSANGSSWTTSRIPVDVSHYAVFQKENISVTKET